MGGNLIMKGQRVNISWMHLITYIEKRDKKIYIGNPVDNSLSVIVTLSGINRAEFFQLSNASF